MTGSLTFASGSTVLLNDILTPFDSTQNYTWFIASATTGIYGITTSTPSINSSALGSIPSYGQFSFDLQGTTGGNQTLYVVYTVPEPTTFLALGALGLAVVGRLRRRKGAAEAAPEPNVALAV